MLRLLSEMGFDWTPLDYNACAAARFKRLITDAPAIVGLVGGASSGKSTLFNTLLGREVSRISAHAHETLGPIVAVHAASAERLRSWVNEGMVLAEFEPLDAAREGPTTGQLGTVCICGHECTELGSVLLFDMPDVTSKMSADEGSIARRLLPWFDGLIIVVDEERWFDAAVFDEIVERSRNFGPRLWVVFNRTERADALARAEVERLARHAERHHSADHCVSPFRPGCGYRPASSETRRRLVGWVGESTDADRVGSIEGQIRRRCADVVRENVTRAAQHEQLCRTVDDELSALAADTDLSLDLLTNEERTLLGWGHGYLPLYDAYHHLRRRLRLWGVRRLPPEEVDFEKRTERLSEVLRRNLEMRFRRATDRVDEITADSVYLADRDGSWSNTWRLPPFDDEEWAIRIRAHIDAWKEETSRQARTGDVAALSVGVPLLLADLLFLGGAGITLTWAAVWVTGFLGGKGLARAVQHSEAFAAYKTTVRAYQTLIREALTEQWEANLAALPRRHMRMSDPALASLMHWATPRRR